MFICCDEFRWNGIPTRMPVGYPAVNTVDNFIRSEVVNEDFVRYRNVFAQDLS